MREGVTPSNSSEITLSRRRLAFCAVAAVAALLIGFLAAKVASPGRSHPASPAVPASPAPAAASSTPPAASSTPAAASSTPAAGTPPPAAAPATSPVSPAQPPAAASAAAGQVPPTSLPSVAFADRRTGIRLAYPRTWTRLASRDPTVPLLVSSRDGASLQVRGVQLPQPITGPRLAAIRDATGLLIKARPQVKIIAGPRLLADNGLPGFLYIYTFYDPISRQRVGHSQISLFSGRRMYTLVFQTARESGLTRFAMLFDKITASFHAG